VLLVDIANVMGSVPDGWWRDRAGAATRLLNGLESLVGAEVTDPDGRAGNEQECEDHRGEDGGNDRRAPP